MSLLHAVISRGSTVLAEYGPEKFQDSVFPSVLVGLLKRLPADGRDDFQTYVQEFQLFHVLTKDAICFGCLCDQALPRSVASQFLEDLQKAWFRTYQQLGQNARAYQMQADFSRTVQQIFESAQQKHDMQTPDRVAMINLEISKTKQTLVTSIDKAIERGDKIELLVDKTEKLDAAAVQFRRKAKEVRQTYCWQSWRNTVVFGIIALAVIYVILVFSCGGFDIKNCR